MKNLKFDMLPCQLAEIKRQISKISNGKQKKIIKSNYIKNTKALKKQNLQV